MAEPTRVPGRGYGNFFVDALIDGNDSIPLSWVWDKATGPISVFWGESTDFAEARDVHGSSDTLTSASRAYDWLSQEKSAFEYAMKLYQSVCGIRFEKASSAAEADIVWWKTDLPPKVLGESEMPQDQTWTYFDSRDSWWSNFKVGGAGLSTIIHEIGHSLGLAHPHDGNGALFPGVDSAFDRGSLGHNQTAWTVMSYNRGLSTAPHSSIVYGDQGGLGAFDIAALQALYGPNMTSNTGHNTYVLPRINTTGTGWRCIWDAGGTDTISAAGAISSVTIDLRAATLNKGSAYAGGYVSSQNGIGGGFTIAKGVFIERALGGGYADKLVGNTKANLLAGYGGNDRLYGGSGDDKLIGGAGNDILVGGSGSDVFLFNSRPNARTNKDTITDFQVSSDKIYLENSIFKKLTKTGPLSSKNFAIGSAKDSSDYIVYNKSTGVLSYDSDGSGKTYDPIAFAQLDKNLKLLASHFVII